MTTSTPHPPGSSPPGDDEWTTPRSVVDSSSLPTGPSDAELLAAARTGDADSYGELFTRHAPAAKALARSLARNDADADDLVAEAFTKVLNALRNGNGPTAALRPYLLTTVRRVHVDRAVAAKKVQPVEDMSNYDPGEVFVDPALQGLERTLVARAYQQLPERWQTVLWHTEVEGLSAKEIAPLLGMTPNAVSALSMRARNGLRDAYLAAHIPDPKAKTCETVMPKLASFVRGSSTQREQTEIQTHLDSCEDCATVIADLHDVGVGMRSVIGPLILGLSSSAYIAGLTVVGTGAAIGAAAVGSSAGTASAGAAGAGATSGGAVGAPGGGAGGSSAVAVGAATTGLVVVAATAAAIMASQQDDSPPAPTPTVAATSAPVRNVPSSAPTTPPAAEPSAAPNEPLSAPPAKPRPAAPQTQPAVVGPGPAMTTKPPQRSTAPAAPPAAPPEPPVLQPTVPTDLLTVTASSPPTAPSVPPTFTSTSTPTTTPTTTTVTTTSPSTTPTPSTPPVGSYTVTVAGDSGIHIERWKREKVSLTLNSRSATNRPATLVLSARGSVIGFRSGGDCTVSALMSTATCSINSLSNSQTIDVVVFTIAVESAFKYVLIDDETEGILAKGLINVSTT